MEKTVLIEDLEMLSQIFGSLGTHSRMLEERFQVRIAQAPNGIRVSGYQETPVNAAAQILARLVQLRQSGVEVTAQLVRYLVERGSQGDMSTINEFSPDCVCISAKGKPIQSKTLGQTRYIDAIRKHEVTFAIGPAGTGKTFLAVAMAVQAFRAHQIDRIILTRPAVEAGEKLGFLPGDLQMKVDPYMRPLYDALHELMGADNYLKNMERGLIEVSPLAYMRGRTLDNAFIILDEAQNTTPEQMKMFLTRIGFNSRVVVTGDITQIDLPGDKRSGLIDATHVLKGVDGLAFVTLQPEDVVRNGIVQTIIRAYDKAAAKKNAKPRAAQRLRSQTPRRHGGLNYEKD